MDVYFISGMCANCHVFDQLVLPDGYKKKYIEWLMPLVDESLDSYVHRLAKSIDNSQPFILVGYSLGGIVVQEMNRFLSPQKTIIISSMKSKEEFPPQIKLSYRISFADRIFKKIYFENKKLINAYVRLMFGLTQSQATLYISHTSFNYMHWAIKQISEWQPQSKCLTIYHIHGTKDRTFPYKRIKDAYLVEGGDHLMVVKKAKEVNHILNHILNTSF